MRILYKEVLHFHKATVRNGVTALQILCMWVVKFTPYLHYLQREDFLVYSYIRRLDGAKKQLECCGEKKTLLCLPGI